MSLSNRTRQCTRYALTVCIGVAAVVGGTLKLDEWAEQRNRRHPFPQGVPLAASTAPDGAVVSYPRGVYRITDDGQEFLFQPVEECHYIAAAVGTVATESLSGESAGDGRALLRKEITLWRPSWTRAWAPAGVIREPCLGLTFDPTGATLLLLGENEIVRYAVAGRPRLLDRRPFPMGATGLLRRPCYSADGARLLAQDNDGVVLIDVATLKVLARATAANVDAIHFAAGDAAVVVKYTRSEPLPREPGNDAERFDQMAGRPPIAFADVPYVARLDPLSLAVVDDAPAGDVELSSNP